MSPFFFYSSPILLLIRIVDFNIFFSLLAQKKFIFFSLACYYGCLCVCVCVCWILIQENKRKKKYCKTHTPNIHFSIFSREFSLLIMMIMSIVFFLLLLHRTRTEKKWNEIKLEITSVNYHKWWWWWLWLLRWWRWWWIQVPNVNKWMNE